MKRQVANILNMQNRPKINTIYNLPLDSLVLQHWQKTAVIVDVIVDTELT